MNTQTKKSDAEIQKDVVNELAWDTRVSSTEIGVQVKNGVVTLIGIVDSWAKVRAAQKAVHRVKGVLDVANDLDVKLPGSAQKTDSDIAAAVRTALEWDVSVPDRQIQSTVSQGVVTLEGSVAYWSQRNDVEWTIERLAGVIRVLNRIEVKPVEQVDVHEAQRAVAKALERHAEREAARIDLRATDRVVDVTGIVHTWQEKTAVLGAVRGTRGVREVRDHLSVHPYA